MYFPARLPIDEHYLTAREAEVVWYCLKGLTICETADQLFISPNTVGNHHSNIRSRFGLRGYHALQQFAQRIQPVLENYTKAAN
ncbi:response regulator transcription factor [uncultured Fibrella sp.]|uniref:response regulator transcription factor n=1 Tax=uncultured Fibrella sp. TaxID=1284596 RepID=UPI0035CA9CF6